MSLSALFGNRNHPPGECPRCVGYGKLDIFLYDKAGNYVQEKGEMTCDRCSGRGKIDNGAQSAAKGLIQRQQS